MSEFDNIVNSTAEAAEMRGHAKGHAKEMLADGIPVDKIAKFTDLSIEEIEMLKF